MQAAWVQDLLALMPPVAFLVGVRVSRFRASTNHPYGFHQSVHVAHFLSPPPARGSVVFGSPSPP